MKALVILFWAALLFAVAVLCAIKAHGAPVQLFWSPSVDTNVVGYKVYYGPESGDYTNSIDVGYVTSVTLDFPDNSVFYFALTAYDPFTEGDFSNEQTYTTPVHLGIVRPPFISLPGMGTTDLLNWHQTNWLFQLSNGQEFFRFGQPTITQ